jgi:curved DNA-binding protein CbpA
MPPSVPDPYRALGLPHDATPEQVKRSYRELARRHHPDRLLSRRRRGDEESRRESGGGNNSGGDEKEEKEGEDYEGDEEERHRREHGLATARFAEISAAYALLSDPRRKAEYDHVYKYGGYDDINEVDQEEEEAKDGGRSARRRDPASAAAAPASASAPPHSSCHPTSRKRKSSTGVGYAYADPLAFLWTGGRVHARAAAAGVELPPSRHSGGARDLPFGGGGGIRFAFSSAHLAPASPAAGAPPGTRVWRSETTTYSLFGRGGAGGAGGGGRPAVDRRVETTTIRPDGTTETTVRLNPPAASSTSSPAPPARFPLPAFSLFPGGASSARASATTTAAATAATSASASSPWYAHAWSGIKDRVLMCYGAPCGPPAARAAAR